jgi:hypothetical protein
MNWTEGVQFPARIDREDNHESCVEELNMHSEMKGLDRKQLTAKYTNRRADKGHNNSQEGASGIQGTSPLQLTRLA